MTTLSANVAGALTPLGLVRRDEAPRPYGAAYGLDVAAWLRGRKRRRQARPVRLAGPPFFAKGTP